MLTSEIIKEDRKFDLPVISESADPRMIDEIAMGGVNIYGVEKGNNSINEGIDFMQGYRIHVTKRSFNLLKEYHNYVWDKDKDGNYINKPIDAWNHGIDACRYYCLGKLLGKVRIKQDLSGIFGH